LWAEQWSTERHVRDGDLPDVVELKRAHLRLWSDANVKIPRPFSILPVQRLQRRMVHYESTALSAFICD
jgi:hypothetical protein